MKYNVNLDLIVVFVQLVSMIVSVSMNDIYESLDKYSIYYCVRENFATVSMTAALLFSCGQQFRCHSLSDWFACSVAMNGKVLR